MPGHGASLDDLRDDDPPHPPAAGRDLVAADGTLGSTKFTIYATIDGPLTSGKLRGTVAGIPIRIDAARTHGPDAGQTRLTGSHQDPRRCSRLPRERSCTSSENGTTIAPVLLPDPAGATACPTAGRPLAHAAPSSARRQQAGHARNDHGDEAALPAADDVRVLATSREPLRVPGEARYRLAPLALPDPDDLASAARAEAVALFADRARAAMLELI